MEQINALMAKSKDMNACLISFVSQCLKSPRFGVPPLSTSAPSSSVEASLPFAATSSSLSSSTDSLLTAGSSSFPLTFTTAKRVIWLNRSLLPSLLLPTVPHHLLLLAPTLVDSKACLAHTEIHDGCTAVYVSMANLTDEDVKLHVHQCIASLEVCAPDVSTIAFADKRGTVAAVVDILESSPLDESYPNCNGAITHQ
ncbi:hypothetical protein QOT17_023400 [Balamuthia mandrillaris]